jgi:hypothetical protein
MDGEVKFKAMTTLPASSVNVVHTLLRLGEQRLLEHQAISQASRSTDSPTCPSSSQDIGLSHGWRGQVQGYGNPTCEHRERGLHSTSPWRTTASQASRHMARRKAQERGDYIRRGGEVFSERTRSCAT